MPAVEQLTLQSKPELVATATRGTPQEQWDRAVTANPWLVGEVVRTLRQLVDAGLPLELIYGDLIEVAS